MFDVDGLLADLGAANAETTPVLAVRDVLERAVDDPAAVMRALGSGAAGIVPLLATDSLSVLHVVWAPRMRFRPHNHLMWAAIAMYGGQEDNVFYRRGAHGIEESGGRSLVPGDVALLGDDTIHAVRNPLGSYAAAIHVYGGDITRRPDRSEWEEPSGREVPYDFERTKAVFAAAEAVSRSTGP